MEALEIGIRSGFSYHNVWRMLRGSGVEVSRSTVRRYYYKRFPERLGKRGPCLDRSIRIKVFGEVKRLRGLGHSYNKIIREIEEVYGVRLSKSQVSEWLRGIHNPFNGCRIPSIDFLEKTPELAYVIGVVSGDGWAVRKRKGDARIGGMVKDREFIEEFSRCLGQVLNRYPPKPAPIGNGFFRVIVQSKALYDLLRKPIDIEVIRPFVEHCEECMKSFLRGFFDSEGSVSSYGSITCVNTDERLINYVKMLLNNLGIKTTGPHLQMKRGTPFFSKKRGKTYRTRKDAYSLYIRTCSRLKFYELVGFTIKKRQQRLEEYLRRLGRLNMPPSQTSPQTLSSTPISTSHSQYRISGMAAGGTRTHDRRVHSPECYQLHHRGHRYEFADFR